MSNLFLNISMITNDALRVLVNNLTIARYVNRGYDDSFGASGAKIGFALNVRKPVRYVGGEGPALQLEDVTETSVPITLNRQPHVGITFTSADLKLAIDEFSKRLIVPAVANIANKVDVAVAMLYQFVYNTASGTTPGTTPTDNQAFLNSQIKLNNSACPMDGQRRVFVTPKMEAVVTYGLKALFQSATQIKEQYEKGYMGTAAGYEWSMDQNIVTQVVGNLGTAGASTSNPIVTVAGQTGAVVLTSGWNATIANVLNLGDIVQFAGVHSVNPQSHLSTGELQDFVITAPVNSDGGTLASLPISPSIITAGAYQTVDVSPAASAAVTVYGIAHGSFTSIQAAQSPQALGYHPDAFTLACADLPLPEGVDMAARAADADLGLSLRLIRQYSIDTDQLPCRVDLLFGTAALRPELAVRIPG